MIQSNIITLIETDEYIMICGNADATSIARWLYGDMNVAVETTEMPIMENVIVNSDDVKFIFSIMGRVFVKDLLAQHMRSPKMLLDAILRTIEFNKLRARYEVASIRSTKEQFSTPTCKTSALPVPIDKTNMNKYSFTLSINNTITTECSMIATVFCTVVYSLLYNIAIVVCDLNIAQSDIKTHLFDEFEVIGELGDVSHEIFENCRMFFHKKTFTGVDDVRAKLQSFCALYDMKKSRDTEKHLVHQFVLSTYVVCEEHSFRVKVSDLYEQLKKIIIISETAMFRVRVYGYLLELGIVKKRFSDGYYYVGLKKRFDTMAEIDILSVEKSRESEMTHTWRTLADLGGPTPQPPIKVGNK